MKIDCAFPKRHRPYCYNGADERIAVIILVFRSTEEAVFENEKSIDDSELKTVSIPGVQSKMGI
jgi:hypothetical protein